MITKAGWHTATHSPGEHRSSRAGAWGRGVLLVVGVSHRTAPLDLRERLALDLSQWRLVAPDRTSSLLLATCNRTEVYAWDSVAEGRLSTQLARALAVAAGVSLSMLTPHLFTKRGPAAMRHLVRVTSGLDSLVVGEHQILGQVRDAARLARAAGRVAPPLEGVVTRALEAGRRVRLATSLGRHRSVAALAIDIAARAPELGHAGLNGKHALILGAGTTAKAAAEALLAAGARVTFLNRTPNHAAEAARGLGAGVGFAPLTALLDFLADATLVVGATAAREPIIDASAVQAAVAQRAGAPLILVDIAVPRDFAPAARSVPGVNLIDLDDLDRLCPSDLVARRAEIARAETLAAAEAVEIARWLRVRAMSPAIAAVRQHGQAIRDLELRRAARQLSNLTPEERTAVEHVTRAIVNKLLHGPTVALREAAAVSGAGIRSSQRVFDVLRLRPFSEPHGA